MGLPKFVFHFASLVLVLSTGLVQQVAIAQQSLGTSLKLSPQPARVSSVAALAPMLGAARAGKRIVAVGDFGVVLLSDDEGKTFRQAAKVPVSSTLTAVSFADEQHGWAVGHWGAVLHTSDGGETWETQRLETQVDRPLFSVYFFDHREGVAVGLWSLMLHTADGGKTWKAVDVPAPPEGGKADRNLFKIFSSPRGGLFVAAERGVVLRSDDHGLNWRYLQTGYNGSFWSGLALSDGTLLIAGLRGTIYRSADDGQNWTAVVSGSKSSVTDMVAVGDRVVGVALDGVQLESKDRGMNFVWKQRSDRLALTAALPLDGEGVLRFSRQGVVRDDGLNARIR